MKSLFTSCLFVLIALQIAFADSDTSRLVNESTMRSLSQFQGLSSARITAILKDKNGFVWFGTDNGLNRYDGTEITVFSHDINNPKSLGNNKITCLYQDHNQTLWIGTKKGLYTFNYIDQTFTQRQPANTTNNIVNSICEDHDNQLWLSIDAQLFKSDPLKEHFVAVPLLKEDGQRVLSGSLELLVDSKGEMWIGTWNEGIYRMNPITGEYLKYNTEELEHFKSGRVTDIQEGPDGSVWFGCWNLGLLRIYPDRIAVESYVHDDAKINSLNDNRVKTLAFDTSGYLWIGIEEAGLDRFAPEDKIFSHYFSDFQSSDIYEGPSVYSILIDDQQLMWLGFRNDGVKIIPLQLPHFPSYKNHKLDDARIFSMCETPEGIYMGIRGAIDLLNVSTHTYTTFKLPNHETAISLHYDGASTIFVGTYKGSLFNFNIQTKKFSPFSNMAFQKQVENSKMECFYPLNDDHILIGTQWGIYKVSVKDQSYKLILNDWVHAIIKNKEGELMLMCWGYFYQYFPQTGKLNKYSPAVMGDIKSEYLTLDNKMYLGTDLGFYQYNIITDETKLYQNIFPFVNNQVNAIVADNQDNIWFTSENELILFNHSQNKFRTFSQTNGLPKIRFYDGVGIKLKNGSVAFGGDGGLTVFDPLKIEPGNNAAPLAFTRMTVLNEPVNMANLYLSEPKSKIPVLNLKHKENIVTIHFALLSYVNPEKHQFKYKLQGFQEKWFDLGNQPYVTFTNLDPGHYTLRIKAADHDNNWGPEQALIISISPPFYQTWYAYAAYFVLAVVGVLLLRQFFRNRERLKSKLKYELLKFDKMKTKIKHESEFAQMRLKFFTNISHEFRTPLTLILGPLENFVKNNRPPTEDHLRLMYKNADRLQRLITQLLDFRSMESKNLKLELSWGDIVQFTSETAQLFTPLAQQKNLIYTITIEPHAINAWFDRDKWEKILYNLLSNAFKHTLKGNITISLTTHSRQTLPYKSKRWNDTSYDLFLELSVKDSGEGIPEDKIQHIFDRFYHLQSQNNVSLQGTGIGLALTKELVQIHNGKILVSSKENEGSDFRVIIPIQTHNEHEETEEVQRSHDLSEASLSLSEEILSKELEDEEKHPIILLVEDNDDLREYMHVELGDRYKIVDAKDGQEGLAIAFKIIPDLILSDLIMPLMDGITFCKEIKNDSRTSHIPIIILTAHGSHMNKVQGYEIGADDYMTKPFSTEMLALRIENLLRNRSYLQSKFSREVRLQPKDLAISSMDERFLTKAMEVVEQNLSNSEFNADSFASEMFMSRVHLYRKLKALTDQSVSDFVKTARLKLAANLIGENKLTIKEAAYAVGFKDPKYFSKCFKQQFGVIPSEYTENVQD